MMGYTVSVVQISANRRTAFLLAQALSSTKGANPLVTAPRAGPLGRLTHMTEQGRPTGIQYEDAANAAMHGGSVDFEGRKVRVLSLNSKTGTDEAPSAQLDLDLVHLQRGLCVMGYSSFYETSNICPEIVG